MTASARAAVRAAVLAAALAAALAASLPLQAAPSGGMLQLNSTQHSDPLPLHRFGDDDIGPALSARSGRNLAYLDNELRLSHRRGPNTWSLLTRQSATVIASQGTVDLAADAETSGRPAGDRQWAVQARYFAFAGSGLAWQRAFTPAPGWQLDVGAQGLLLQRWRERHLTGQAGYEAALQSYHFDLQSFEADNELAFPYQRSFAPRGHALLLDGQLRWAGSAFGARVAWRDAGWLRWRGLPQNQSALSTQTQTYDADGFVVYQPLIQGQNSQAGRSRHAPARVILAGDWRPDARTTVELRGEWLQHFGVLPALSAEHRVGDATWGIAWHSHERRATASVAWRGLRLRVGADRFGDAAHSREMSLAGAWSY